MKHPLQYRSMLRGKLVSCCFLLLMVSAGCKKYLQVPVPINSIAGSAVFENDYSSAAALNSIYVNLYLQGNFDGPNGIAYLSGIYGDEFTNYSANVNNIALYSNSVSSSLGNVSSAWVSLYKQLYSVNLAIEGLTPAGNLTYRDQWLGEAYFLRGLIYFYLTNMYRDVPLVLSSDYLHNNGLARSSQDDVYNQIIADLQEAESLLSVQYRDNNGLVVNNNRSRPNRSAAEALLARVYLYRGDWQNAADRAGNVIANATYQLVQPASAFLVNSQEIIWGIVPVQNATTNYKVKDVHTYIIPKGRTPIAAFVSVALSDSLVKAFEPNDLRYTHWVGIDSVPASASTPAAVYYFAHKYKANGNYTTAQETVVMLRLAEQYLIRAEARTKLNDLTGALADLNAVRTRAGLPASTAGTQAEIMGAIQRERRVEFFAESGHRYFDLRRTGMLDPLMTKISATRGGNWISYKAWWPIPLSDIQNNPRLEQTFGYQ
ncbi:RagB/SusD family nutrient uptake outer membrane protein [Longitalea arenae]|uniref:RagB/SusD family nutrient uptake outer membrane protein n=1 Tax=Longitalea arenae TaxID=2812558 RepID=UPI001966EB45|nr:RagB/SusD family nutrient uptake outer membrane protein [Longitalea arenae]